MLKCLEKHLLGCALGRAEAILLAGCLTEEQTGETLALRRYHQLSESSSLRFKSGHRSLVQTGPDYFQDFEWRRIQAARQFHHLSPCLLEYLIFDEIVGQNLLRYLFHERFRTSLDFQLPGREIPRGLHRGFL